jgi:transposase-like protein
LTPDQKAEIAQALARGEAGNSIAARMGVSTATIYAQKRKAGNGQPAPQAQESALRGKLVSFAVRTLLGQEVASDERDGLEKAVRDEMVRRVSAGI